MQTHLPKVCTFGTSQYKVFCGRQKTYIQFFTDFQMVDGFGILKVVDLLAGSLISPIASGKNIDIDLLLHIVFQY